MDIDRPNAFHPATGFAPSTTVVYPFDRLELAVANVDLKEVYAALKAGARPTTQMIEDVRARWVHAENVRKVTGQMPHSGDGVVGFILVVLEQTLSQSALQNAGMQ